jgi:hypothetical protein
MVTEIELFESTNTNALRIVIKKDTLLSVNDTFVTQERTIFYSSQ